MSIQLRTDITANILPIVALHIQATDTSDLYIFGQPEGESSYSFEEVTATDQYGCARILGWKVTATIYMINNDMETWLADLGSIYNDMRTNDGKRLYVALIELNNQIWNRYADSPWKVHFWSFVDMVSMQYGIESVEVRPRVKITLRGFVPITSIDSTFIP